jgi:hypothetical protein
MSDETTNGPAPQLHPAEGRGYRELYAASRQLTERWRRLAVALDDTGAGKVLTGAAVYIEEMLGELEPRTARYDLHGKPAAQGLGARVGDVRGLVIDRSLDTGPALRLAVLDIEHVVTLLLQLARMAKARGDEELREFDRDWAKRLRPVVRQVRDAAIELGSDPDRAAEPLDKTAVGQVAHKAGWAIGTFGEWFDRTIADRDA